MAEHFARHIAELNHFSEPVFTAAEGYLSDPLAGTLIEPPPTNTGTAMGTARYWLYGKLQDTRMSRTDLRLMILRNGCTPCEGPCFVDDNGHAYTWDIDTFEFVQCSSWL